MSNRLQRYKKYFKYTTKVGGDQDTISGNGQRWDVQMLFGRNGQNNIEARDLLLSRLFARWNSTEEWTDGIILALDLGEYTFYLHGG